MDKYQLNEQIGRDKFQDFINQMPKYTVTFTEDPYDHKDAWVTSTDKKYAAEIKNRDVRYEAYDTYIMEKIKYDELERLYKENVTADGMMAYFFGNTLYLFNLKLIDKLIKNNKIELVYNWLPDSTVNKHKMIQKPCYMLPKEYAHQYEKIDNKWIRTDKPYKI